jgi:hypothetical protein
VPDENELLLKMMEQMREDFARSEESARLSRAAMHDRMEESIDRLGKLETSIAISGQVDAQVRNELDGLKGAIQAIEPTVEQWKDMLKTGRRISWFLGISGLISGAALWAALQWTGDAVINTVRSWLRIT